MRLRWRPGVTAAATSDGEVVVESSTARVALRPVSELLQQALLQFQPPGQDEDSLANLASEGDNGMARWYYCVDRLTRRGLLCYDVHADGSCLATLEPTSSGFVSVSNCLVAEKQYLLSRFAYFRRDGFAGVLESPLAHARIILNDARAAAIVGRLARPGSVDELAIQVCEPGDHTDQLHCLSRDAIAGTMALLLRAGMIQEVNEAGTITEDRDSDLRTWAFHDLLFHARSRKGRTSAPYGGTYRFAGRMEPPPALKQPPPGEFQELARPDLARMEREDPPLARVESQRRSTRSFDRDHPLTASQLGEFLFRVARIRDFRELEVATPAGPIRLDMASRPYPSGGGLYEIEFYIVIRACHGLGSGLYYYDPARHGLVRLDAPDRAIDELLRDAGSSAGVATDELQALIILAARVPRLAWKYESIAYSLILKHVGVLYQSMYLAATAMGLAACAIGGGDSDLFARAAGTRYAAETSVGEFLLGSHQPSRPGSDR
jgi:SagB-type dehydrogenase family enzyme